ncbi:hypothetical protein DFS34DRAFT_396486 [Phlyctochytrium arcticum]|nr:hypothetical protein DFS34DRAFT_396486 [Phlyctochytrium arcticum]
MVTGYYITRPVGRLRGLCQAGYPGVERLLREAVKEIDTAIFDGWNLAHVHFQRQTGAFLSACTDAQQPGVFVVPNGLTLDGCGSGKFFFNNLLRIAAGIPTPGTLANPVPASLVTSNDQFLHRAQRANFTWPDNAAVPNPPGPGEAQLHTKPDYILTQHSQLFLIESNKMRTAFTNYVAFNVQDHIEQIIMHWPQHHHNLALNAGQRDQLVTRTLLLLQPFYICSAIHHNVAGHALTSGNLILFGGLPVAPARQMKYIQFLQPIISLSSWAVRVILNEDLNNVPPAGLATNQAEEYNELFVSKAWKWKWCVGARHNRAHHVLPLLEWLSRYEAAHHPAPGQQQGAVASRDKSIALCPGATGRGVRYVQFDYVALCQILGRRADPPIMIVDPTAAAVRALSKNGRDFTGDSNSRMDVFFSNF